MNANSSISTKIFLYRTFAVFMIVMLALAVLPVAPANAAGPVAVLQAWPATPQLTATNGNLSGTFTISAGTERLLVVAVDLADAPPGATGHTFAATYGGKALTQAATENSTRRSTWIGYLKETDIASRTGDTLTITITGAHTGAVAYIASYTGVNQTTSITAGNGYYDNNNNTLAIGPLAASTGGYGIYTWAGTNGRTRTSDTETYVEHSDVGGGAHADLTDFGIASKAINASTNPTITWSGNARTSVSFVTLNPAPGGLTPQTITIGTPAPATATYRSTFTVAANASSGLAVAYSSGTPTVCTNVGALFTIISGTGTCTVQYNQAGNATYSAAPQLTNNVTAQPATLTYTANATSRAYGAANPTFTGTVTGFLNGETQATATTGVLAFTSAATAASNVGSYAINGSGLTANNGNYTFVQAAGNATALTITPATLTYTANTASRVFGAANPAFTGTVTGFVNGQTQATATTGTLTFTTTATPASPVGSYPINGSGLTANNGNYTFVQAAGNATALTITPAVGTTYYVNKDNPSCSDTLNTGLTIPLPFCTIGKGATVAVAGDTVRVLAGTYAETVNPANTGSAGSPITFSAAPGVTVTGAAPNNNGFRLSGKSYIVIDGFNVTGTANIGIYVTTSNNITISNNNVSLSGSPASGLIQVGINFNATTNSTISGNTTHHNSNHGIYLSAGSTGNTVSNNVSFANARGYTRAATGIDVDGSNNNTIIHNITYANEDTGIQIYNGTTNNLILGNVSYGNADHGIDVSNSPSNTVVGNTVQGNYTSGINVEGTSINTTVANNIAVDNGIAIVGSGQPSNIRIEAGSVAGTTINYDIVFLTNPGTQIQWNGTDYPTLAAFKLAVGGQEGNGTQANPLFVAPVTPAVRPNGGNGGLPAVNVGDYHIAAGSPAIDSANSNAPSEPLLDIAGNARVDDPATNPNTGAGVRTYDDRGAYEFQPGGTLPTVTTEAATVIGATTATGNGTITNLGVPNPYQYGVVWNTAANPTIALATKTTQGAATATGAFTSAITGLTPNTLYHVRAYASNTAGTAYGADVTFTTLPLTPTVTTQAVTVIGTTTATGNGTITDLGIPNPTQYGVVWDTAVNPTIALATKTAQGVPAGVGAFTSSITGLAPNTLYHVRAYATNTASTAYGADVTFTTLPLVPTVTTQAVTVIGTTTATGNGTITDLGVPTPTQYGVVWDTAVNPTIALATKTAQGVPAGIGAFTSSITGLAPNTLYHVRAYATNTAGTAYGADVTFTTLPLIPTVTTEAVTVIGTTTATGNGTITDLGVPTPTQYGVVWDIAVNPTIALATKTAQGVPAGIGAFTSSITGLAPNMLYHVRAYATNTAGTAYGADVTFTTLPLTPTVTTQAVTVIGTTTATGNGTITDLGIPNPTQYGVVWDTAVNPTIALATKTAQGVPAGIGAFTSSITGLAPNTLYHVRAYATNTAGTAYGADVTFTTLPLAPTVTTQAVTVIGATTAIGNGTITDLGAPNPTQYGVVWSTVANPTIADNSTTQGPASATGPFTSAITGLTPNTLYHVRAYATNTAGTAYGADVSFTTSLAAPVATTNAAAGVTTTDATLNGTVNANNSNTTVTFEYGLTTAYGSTVTATPGSVAGTTSTAVNAAITGLTPNTLYHYRVVGVNGGGTTNGLDATFTTNVAVSTATTNAATGVTTTDATLNGTVNANNSNTTVTFEYGLTAAYGSTVTATPSLVMGTTNTAVSAAITGLTPDTLYHYRVVGVNGGGTTNGLDTTFSTDPLAATVTTEAVTAIGVTTATGNGTITDLGIPNPTQHGVVWDTAANPTTADSFTADGAVAATGAFTSDITGLTPGTLYHVRAYATNTAGTAYGADVTFTTTLAPTVTTEAVTAIGTTTATGNGTITDLGIPNPTQHGVVWSTAANPTTADGSTTDGAVAATGAFTSDITGLTPGTLYHVRAYATNTVDTSYGADVTFTTLLAPTITSIAPTTGTVGVPYLYIFAADGNPLPTFGLSGTLPAGLTFDGVDTISGTPTAAGISGNITVTASNGVAPDTTQTFTITITPPTITLSPNSLPDGTNTIAYNQTITASGGTAPFTYAVTTGTLPTGLTLSAAGVLSGTPTVAGPFNFTVTATDAFSSTGSRAYVLTINDLPSATKINSVADTGDGQIIENEHTGVAIKQLLVVFNNDMNATEVVDLANYTLVKNGATNITIDNISYDGPTKTATLSINGGAALSDGSYALTVKSSLHDTTGYAPPADFIRNFVVDTTGPLVTANGINTVIDTGDGVLTEYEVVTIGITKFTVTFNEAVLNVGSSDPRYGDSVINPANYMLIRDLGDTADFQTVDCRHGAVTPADTKIDITAVTYDTSTHVATFTVNGNLPLSKGYYRLYVCGTTSITNLAGIELAGNGTTAGTDFIRNFIVSFGGGGGGKGGHAKKNDTNDTISGLPIPVTGFAPDQVTLLPHQPAEKAYKPLDEIRIEIPTLGINFPIVGVSFIGNNWDLTWLKNSVGYLEGSAYPTFSGNTVLTAHVIDANNNLGPFSDIKGMRLGDRIYLHAYGQVYVYQVQENRKLLPASLTTVFKHEEYEWVTLVTCEDYNTKTKTYDYRRMVRAVLVSVIPEK